MWRYLIPWFVMLLVSVGNGAIRDFTYGTVMPELRAHHLSTVISIISLGFVMWGFLMVWPPGSYRKAVGIGLLWLGFTVAFEFLFFHFVTGHSRHDLLANYNLLKGRVWVFVPLWLGVAPSLFHRLRHPA